MASSPKPRTGRKPAARSKAPSRSKALARKKAPAPRKRLPEYERKRDFAITPEPAPGTLGTRSSKETGERPTFMVHKHDATRLHYDVRLEMDGALASWSVPKGPSYDPAVKRLAIQTEDHPLEYGGFEGRIPDGEYGAGDSLIWDRGVYETLPPGQASQQRKKGHLHVVFLGEKLKGGWHLVRSGRQPGGEGSGKTQWLMFKGKDETADAAKDIVVERPESVVSGRVVTRGPERVGVLRGVHPRPEALLEKLFPPMLATLADGPEGLGEGYVYEVKYDGYRAVCALSAGKVAMWTRNGLDLSARFPRLAQALSRIVVGEAVLDGEIAILDPSGAPRFELIQQGRNDEAVFFGFDLLWLDGEDVRNRPLEERRDLLTSLLSNTTDLLRPSERLEGPAAAALAVAAGRGLEGVMAKEKGSRYEARRSKAWLKVKAQQGQELAIVGFTPSSTGRDEVGALQLGVVQDGALRWAGKVGTGFTAKVRADLWRELSRDVVPKPAVQGAPRARDARWVTPRLVAQVQFTEWTADGKLRHPSFQGLRADKEPMDCVREQPRVAQAGAREGSATGRRTAPGKARSSRRKRGGRDDADDEGEDSTSTADATSNSPATSHSTSHSTSNATSHSSSSSTSTPDYRAPTTSHPRSASSWRSPAASFTPGAAAAAARPEPVDVALTHPERVLYPADGITKAEIAAYYEAVSGPLLRALAGRPLALQHWNQGVHKPPWFQQNIGNEAEEWMHLVHTATRTSRRNIRHLVADRPEALRWLAQHSVLEIHPWHSREGSLTSPDWVVFDLDPADGHGFEQTLEVALALRGMFDRLGLPSYPKTSGRRGLHVYLPLAKGHTYEDSLSFALEVGKTVTRLLKQTTLERSKAQRHGRLYLDCMQNAYGKTLVAPYSLRPSDGAPVSAPLRWSEVNESLDPKAFTLRTMPARLAKLGDLFAGALENGVRLPRV